jgi:hypothetical protein
MCFFSSLMPALRHRRKRWSRPAVGELLVHAQPDKSPSNRSVICRRDVDVAAAAIRSEFFVVLSFVVPQIGKDVSQSSESVLRIHY